MSGSIKSKDAQLLYYLLRIHKHCTAHFLMRLSYILDVFYFESFAEQITSFQYRLYTFGPLDKSIFDRLDELILEGFIRCLSNYTRHGREYVSYVFNNEFLTADDIEFKNRYLPDISLGELLFIRNHLYALLNYDDKRYTKMAYNTKPLKSLGASWGSRRGVGQILKFRQP